LVILTVSVLFSCTADDANEIDCGKIDENTLWPILFYAYGGHF